MSRVRHLRYSSNALQIKYKQNWVHTYLCWCVALSVQYTLLEKVESIINTSVCSRQTRNKLTSSVSVFSEQIYTLNGRLAPVLTYANRHVSILLDERARSSHFSSLRKETGRYLRPVSNGSNTWRVFSMQRCRCSSVVVTSLYNQINLANWSFWSVDFKLKPKWKRDANKVHRFRSLRTLWRRVYFRRRRHTF